MKKFLDFFETNLASTDKSDKAMYILYCFAKACNGGQLNREQLYADTNERILIHTTFASFVTVIDIQVFEKTDLFEDWQKKIVATCKAAVEKIVPYSDEALRKTYYMSLFDAIITCRYNEKVTEVFNAITEVLQEEHSPDIASFEEV